jgi:drug/metabolite transporter (DMT)-like permease
MIWAGVTLVVKHLSRHARSVSIVFYQSLFTTILALVPAALVFSWPQPGDWALLMLLGLLGTSGWLMVTAAYAISDASALTPYDFTRLPFTALIAYLLFGESPDEWTWIGGAIIFAATVYIAHREAVVARERRKPAA